MSKSLAYSQETVHSAASVNYFRRLLPNLGAAGFRTHDMLHGHLQPSGGRHFVESFLLNTRMRRGDREAEQSILNYFTDPSASALALITAGDQASAQTPRPVRSAPNTLLDAAVRQRRSHRQFTGESLDVADLHSILWAGNGVVENRSMALDSGESIEYALRTVASAGGLYPIELYAVALNVRGLASGTYLYHPEDDALSPHGNVGCNDILRCFCVPENVLSLGKAAAVILIVGKHARTTRKYGPRGVRFLFLEAGAVTQNVHLFAQALGHGSTDCASYYEDEMHDALNIDGVGTSMLHAVVIGNLSGEAHE